MKKFFQLILLLAAPCLFAQTIGEFANSVVDDVSKFGKAYVQPAAKGVMFNVNNGWYNSAKVKDQWKFELGLGGNFTLVNREKNKFSMNTEDYNTIRFGDGDTQKRVATIFGFNEPEVTVYIDFDILGQNEEIEITLPQGIDEDVKSAPNVFVQGGIGVGFGTEVKVRYAPKINYGEVEKQLYGGAIQHEVSYWLNEDFPIHLSVLGAYTGFEAFYDVKEPEDEPQNDEQGIYSEMTSWTAALVASTKWEKINLFGGVGYLTAEAETRFDGIYEVDYQNDLFQELVKEFSVTNNVTGINGTIGGRYELEHFNFHAAINLQEYVNFAIGTAYQF